MVSQLAWKKLGRIFDPQAHPDITSHAQVPTVLVLKQCFRVYFAARDAEGKSYTIYLDADRSNPTKVLDIRTEPVLQKGKPGTFDEDGVMPGYVMQHEDRTLLFYSGWNQKVRTPYHNATGLAHSVDQGKTFTRVFEGPILDRMPTEPYLAVTPTLLFDQGMWRMWYISGLYWTSIDGRYEPVYAIKHAFSNDLIHWERPPAICVKQAHELEAFSHPSVIKDGARYRMWYCYRHSLDYRGGKGSYRIGYAESSDGLLWERLDHLSGIDVSAEGWDCEMICYPYIVKSGNSLFMFYNGNGFGKSGIGVAVYEN